MGLFHVHKKEVSEVERPLFNQGAPFEKVSRLQYAMHWLYGVFEPPILRLTEKMLLKKYESYEASDPQKCRKTKNLISGFQKSIIGRNAPQGIIVTTESAKNMLEHVLTNSGPQGARLAVGPCVCQRALKKYQEPFLKDMVILYGADIYYHLNLGYELISLEEGKELLDKYHLAGLTPSIDYCMQSGKWTFVICSCEPDICVLMRLHNITGIGMNKGPEIAYKNQSKCLGAEKCGKCIERCYFGANYVAGDSVEFDSEKCLGCGLCASTCKSEGRIMEKRADYNFDHVLPAEVLLKGLY